jgi:hypothetical protein
VGRAGAQAAGVHTESLRCVALCAKEQVWRRPIRARGYTTTYSLRRARASSREHTRPNTVRMPASGPGRYAVRCSASAGRGVARPGAGARAGRTSVGSCSARARCGARPTTRPIRALARARRCTGIFAGTPPARRDAGTLVQDRTNRGARNRRQRRGRAVRARAQAPELSCADRWHRAARAWRREQVRRGVDVRSGRRVRVGRRATRGARGTSRGSWAAARARALCASDANTDARMFRTDKERSSYLGRRVGALPARGEMLSTWRRAGEQLRSSRPARVGQALDRTPARRRPILRFRAKSPAHSESVAGGGTATE